MFEVCTLWPIFIATIIQPTAWFSTGPIPLFLSWSYVLSLWSVLWNPFLFRRSCNQHWWQQPDVLLHSGTPRWPPGDFSSFFKISWYNDCCWRNTVVFCPIPFYPVELKSAKRRNGWALSNALCDQGRSSWQPEIWFKHWHPTWILMKWSNS